MQRAFALLISMALLAACGGAADTGEADLSAVSSYVTVPDPPLGPASQSLTLTDGRSWRFADVPDGQLTLLMFGYTSCPDVCPTTMADIAKALAELPASTGSKVQAVFVSTDPHRDTPEQLSSWLSGFGGEIVGARAPIEDVVSAAAAYGIGIVAPEVSAGDYEVTHGGQVLVLQPGGAAVGYFRNLAGWRDYAQALPTLVEEHA
ncbi:MAG: hypothetical protein JWM62_1201 [Frankiales bacterium]|jgi:protein SCO1/2|nr:hypothetical protein [Frankiales bacterium]